MAVDDNWVMSRPGPTETALRAIFNEPKAREYAAAHSLHRVNEMAEQGWRAVSCALSVNGNELYLLEREKP